MRVAIIRTNSDLVHRHMYVALGGDGPARIDMDNIHICRNQEDLLAFMTMS